MALELLEFDALGSNVDGTNPGTALVVMSAASNYYVTAFNSPAPNPKPLWATSIDTEGARRADPSTYENRTISLTIETKDTSSVSTHEDALAAKVAKLHREGGTLKWTRKDGSVRIFDILASDTYSKTVDVKYENGRAELQAQFTALPGLRGSETDHGDNTEATLPCLIFTEASIPGELLALARLVADDDQAVDQQWMVWGMEQDRYYTFTDSTGSGGLFYQAESRTALGGSAIAAGPSGASGAGSNVMRNTALSSSYQAILSTQAGGGGAHFTHVGTFAVFARFQAPTTNVGTVTVALEWGQGDFRRFTQNASYELSTTWEGTWRIAPLGLVTIPRILTGSQRWEGRILAKSTTAGDDIDIDWIMLVPTSVGYGELKALNRGPASTGFSARDEFDQTAGALTGKVLPVGGTWAGAGSATDFTVETTVGSPGSRAAAVNRITAGPEGAVTSGRFALAGTATFTNISLGVDYMTASNDNEGGLHGLLARYVDTNNWIVAGYNDMRRIDVWKRVAGTATKLLQTDNNVESSANQPGGFVFTIYANGLWVIHNRSGSEIATGYDADLATGGALASGRIGLYDVNQTIAVRSYDNFWAAVPPTDAALFASQSVQIRHDGVIREDSTGSFWQPPSSYIGDYPHPPPSGTEGRQLRTLVKSSRFAPGEGPDAGTDDLSARLFTTSRFLT